LPTSNSSLLLPGKSVCPLLDRVNRPSRSTGVASRPARLARTRPRSVNLLPVCSRQVGERSTVCRLRTTNPETHKHNTTQSLIYYTVLLVNGRSIDLVSLAASLIGRKLKNSTDTSSSYDALNRPAVITFSERRLTFRYKYTDTYSDTHTYIYMCVDMWFHIVNIPLLPDRYRCLRWPRSLLMTLASSVLVFVFEKELGRGRPKRHLSLTPFETETVLRCHCFSNCGRNDKRPQRSQSQHIERVHTYAF